MTAIRSLEPEPEASGPQVTRRWITPAVAADWIAKNTRNRPVRQSLVLKYAGDMKENRWRLNGSTVVMSSEGNIIDGQHRLLAIIQAGVNVEMFVASNVDEAAFATIDSGKARSLADVLHILGYTDSNALAALARGWEEFERSGKIQDSNRRHALVGDASIQTLMTIAQEHAEVFHAAIRGAHAARREFKGATASWAIAWIKFGELSEEDRDFFFERLVDGQNLSDGQPIYALRRFFASATENHRILLPNMVFAILIKAWNRFRAREAMKVLIYTASEVMPVPI